MFNQHLLMHCGVVRYRNLHVVYIPWIAVIRNEFQLVRDLSEPESESEYETDVSDAS